MLATRNISFTDVLLSHYRMHVTLILEWYTFIVFVHLIKKCRHFFIYIVWNIWNAFYSCEVYSLRYWSKAIQKYRVVYPLFVEIFRCQLLMHHNISPLYMLYSEWKYNGIVWWYQSPYIMFAATLNIMLYTCACGLEQHVNVLKSDAVLGNVSIEDIVILSCSVENLKRWGSEMDALMNCAIRANEFSRDFRWDWVGPLMLQLFPDILSIYVLFLLQKNKKNVSLIYIIPPHCHVVGILPSQGQ